MSQIYVIAFSWVFLFRNETIVRVIFPIGFFKNSYWINQMALKFLWGFIQNFQEFCSHLLFWQKFKWNSFNFSSWNFVRETDGSRILIEFQFEFRSEFCSLIFWPHCDSWVQRGRPWPNKKKAKYLTLLFRFLAKTLCSVEKWVSQWVKSLLDFAF